MDHFSPKTINFLNLRLASDLSILEGDAINATKNKSV